MARQTTSADLSTPRTGRESGVVLDVVYNHFGPVGNYLGSFRRLSFRAAPYRLGRGDQFRRSDSGPVREFIIANAGYWIDEFHVDGLRLDAVHAILDDSPDHILAALTRRVREAAGRRGTLVFAESEVQDTRLLRPADGAATGSTPPGTTTFTMPPRVAMTGHSEYYYGDYQGSPQELISAIKWGYLYQGQWNPAAIAAPRLAGLRSASPAICDFLAEPRPGGQLAARQADARADIAWSASGA